MEYLRIRSAELMMKTKRVGDPNEDPSMKKMRPKLSDINRLGLITIDSQMGIKEKNHWQRAYIFGFATRELADQIVLSLRRMDSLVVLIFPHGESIPKALQNYALANMPRLEMTLDGPNLVPSTRQPTGAAMTFAEGWNALLPELHNEMHKNMSPSAIKQLKKECQMNSVQVFIMDTVWGRPTWLFNTILEKIKIS